MADFVYDKARQAFLDADIDWSADVIRAVFVVTGVGRYVPNSVTDQFLAIIAANDRSAFSAIFATKTSTAGVADADDVLFALLALPGGGGLYTAIVIFVDTGVAATSRIIAFIDTDVGLPFLASGADVLQRWDNGANKIFKL